MVYRLRYRLGCAWVEGRAGAGCASEVSGVSASTLRGLLPPSSYTLILHIDSASSHPALAPPSHTTHPTTGVKEANKEDQGWVIKDGIVVVIKDSVIPSGTII